MGVSLWLSYKVITTQDCWWILTLLFAIFFRSWIDVSFCSVEVYVGPLDRVWIGFHSKNLSNKVV